MAGFGKVCANSLYDDVLAEKSQYCQLFSAFMAFGKK